MSNPSTSGEPFHPVVYLGAPESAQSQIRDEAGGLNISEVLRLSRRGHFLGWIGQSQRPPYPPPAQTRRLWQASEPVLLPGFVTEQVNAHQRDLERSHELVEAILAGQAGSDLLHEPDYAARFAGHFEHTSTSEAEWDDQEVEKLHFDGIDGNTVIGEDLWLKIAWLSLYEDDASLRFRFSFGMENYEDVAADFEREYLAAQLAETIFPESAIITANPALADYLRQTLDIDRPVFVERIIYFNAPEGGAQLHQDVERGHAGVIYVQATGRTAWLGLSKEALMDEVQAFLQRGDAAQILESFIHDAADRAKLFQVAEQRPPLAAYLDSPDNEPLETLLNRVPAFCRQLIDNGHGYILQPGDALLLPQQDLEHCAWHSVFCIDDAPGEALSFAIRPYPDE